MCEGNYLKDPSFVASNHGMKSTKYQAFDREKATYLLRGRYKRIGGKNCVYCGFEAETGDHVPALYAGYTNGVKNGVIVPVCYDCNGVLKTFSSTCYKERLELLALVFDQKAEKNQGWVEENKRKNIKNPNPKWQILADTFKGKAAHCRKQKEEINCYMLDWK